MKGIGVYERIQESKRMGYSKQKTADRLHCCWRTVDKYWDMPFEEYGELETRTRKTECLTAFDDHIVSWLKRHPDMSAAQVYDWLLERFGDDAIDASERTVRRHVARLRTDHSIPKKESPRDYVAFPDPPMGRQMQVDFGESWMEDATGRRVHVRFAGFVLSYSRYRYVRFQSRPFTSHDLVEAMRGCFVYLGGRTEEIVFDQDSVVSVAENGGDIVLTREMTMFKAECGFEVYLCRGADPETKGRIERTVRFVKGNFVKHRIYPGDDAALNDAAIAWLERTGNAKPNGTTKETPASRFAAERAFLIECETAAIEPELERRNVRKDNTIIYLQNRYSLPLGTFNRMKTVAIDADGDRLHVFTMAGDPVCTHTISASTGQLVQKSAHRHDRTTKTLRLKVSLVGLLGHDCESFLDSMIDGHERYECDQLALLQHAYAEHGRKTLLAAIDHCRMLGIYSANDVIGFAKENQSPPGPAPRPDLSERYPVTVVKRDVADYAEVV